MSYKVVIVESPAKCSKIESFLGPGYKCIASYGHIQQLKDLKHINMGNNFEPLFTIIDAKKNQISKIRNVLRNASEMILATDDDREGEAIAWHICQVFNKPVHITPRIIFHEITKSAIQAAVANPTTINMNIVHAQQARQILDLLVGYKLSPILWNQISQRSKAGLSAGRCQTPALRLVYENQKDIDDSPGTKVYNTIGYFTNKNIQFQLNHQFNTEEETEEFLEESVNHDHIFEGGVPRSTTKKPPTPFTTFCR